ncbi:NAD(P)H-binding protein [Actinomadura barringtoniae]|uniref:NAD(P)H-binding protein n=1 Tax=Actinomadura barringtoniae TaxID=1427535 RepID=A0A939P9T0_9ACTN|nr:NAD(P)H-binding protein [Actinomadura barringtoniae]MBO2448142.1 NAD(P)H-binding protein [Actinomadura barringtoniae]
MILITGATGNVGRHLVTALLDAGEKVRALTRDPATASLPEGAEVARTDEMPMDDVEAVFFNPAASWNGPGELLEKAAAHGVRRVVMLSSLACTYEEGPANPIGTHHLKMEREVEASGLEWTFLRPGLFATNSLVWADQIRNGGAVQGAYAEAQFSPTHERDIADAAAQAFLTDDHVGAKPLLTGPESLTHAEMVATVGEAIGRPARFEEIAPEVARERMVGGHMTPQIADSILRMQAAAVGVPALIAPDVERVIGHPARTFAQWAADHAADFS